VLGDESGVKKTENNYSKDYQAALDPYLKPHLACIRLKL
jgi:hypothetical protein